MHYLLLSGVDHPLAAYYDTVADVRGTPFDRPGRDDVAAAFTDFCRLHRGELERLIATRTTQTNEVGRCTALLPGLCHIASLYGWEVPLSLLDLGTSAGLNLLFDDYALHLPVRRPATPSVTAGTPGSAVALECSARDDLSTCPSSACPPWRSGSASTSPRSTPSPTTPPCGCWPASGRTTRPASAASAARWPTSAASAATRPDSSRATW